MSQLSLGNMDVMYNGLPVVVRLITGENVMCILYEPRTEEDPRVMMERPLEVVMEESIDLPDLYKNAARSNTIYAKVRTRFDRWLPLTDATLFPVYPDHIVCIAPVSPQFVNSYMEWSDQLYDQPFDATPPQKASEPVANTTTTSSSDIRESYFDFILHSYVPKGKPN